MSNGENKAVAIIEDRTLALQELETRFAIAVENQKSLRNEKKEKGEQ